MAIQLPRSSLEWRRKFFSLLVSIGIVAVMYGSLIQYAYSDDDLQYAMAIESASTGAHFYHPEGRSNFEVGPSAQVSTPSIEMPMNSRYPFEIPTSVIIARLWKVLGWNGDVIPPILMSRAMAGTFGLLFLYLAVYRLGKSYLIACVVTIGLATSAAYWTYSTHLDQSIDMVALLSLAFFLLVSRNGSARAFDDLVLAVVLALATLYNLTAVITTFVFGVAVAMREEQVSRAIKRFIRFGFAYLIPMVIFFLFAVARFSWLANLVNPEYWRLATFQGHPEYNIEPLRDALRGALGFAKAQIIYPGVPGSLQFYWDGASMLQRLVLLGFYSVILIFMALPFLFIFRRRRNLRHNSQLGITLLLWLLLWGVFNWFWDPGYIKYWLVPLLAWWIVMALTLVHLKDTHSHGYRAAMTGVLLFVGLGLVINLTTQFLPQSNQQLNPWLTIAESLKTSEPSALFISSGHPLDFYIAFYTHRDIVSLGLTRYGAGGDESVVKRVLNSHIEQHRSVGGKVYVYGNDLLSAKEGNTLFDILTLHPLRVSWSFPELDIYKVEF